MAELKGVLKLGKIGFLNSLPIYYALENGLVKHPFDIYEASPSELNTLVSRGELGVSAVSSLEYGCNYHKYLLIPEISISSVGPVKSVILFSDYPVDELDQRDILLTKKSYTSVYLLRLLFKKYWKVNPHYLRVERIDYDAERDKPAAVLAIGDDALKLLKSSTYRYHVDLGDVWYKWTGKPFVFAVWVINKDIVVTLNGHMELAYKALIEAKEFGLKHLSKIALEASLQNILSFPECLEYFRQLSYDLTEEYLEGLELFFSYLVESKMLPERPELRFYSCV